MLNRNQLIHKFIVCVCVRARLLNVKGEIYPKVAYRPGIKASPVLLIPEIPKRFHHLNSNFQIDFIRIRLKAH